MATKQIVKDFEAGKTVDTQELAAAMMEDVKTPKKKVAIFVALEPFDFGGTHYNAGDEIALTGWQRDAEFDKTRALKSSPAKGLSFSKDGEPINKSTGERNAYRVVLPVKEA